MGSTSKGADHMKHATTSSVVLRAVRDDDLAIFFEQQMDPAANLMVAFTKRERDEEGELTPAHIFIYDLSTRRTMQLTNSDKGESGIQWLSDNQILFRSDRDGESKWWTISLYGGEGMALFEDEAPGRGCGGCSARRRTGSA